MTSNEQPSTFREQPWLWARAPDAGEYGPWVGKWLLYLPAEQVDDRWRVIAEATSAGRLGISAKVATAWDMPEGGRHVVCVYTADCRDLADVARVLAGLRTLGYTGRLSYKEDGATFAQVYGRGAALYVAQPASTVPERRREPLPVPPEHL